MCNMAVSNSSREECVGVGGGGVGWKGSDGGSEES
jgi:hypothetical protein